MAGVRLPGRRRMTRRRALDGGRERRSRLYPVDKTRRRHEAEWLVAMGVWLRCMRVTERHVSGDRLHARPKVGDPLRQPLELPAGLDLLSRCAARSASSLTISVWSCTASEHRIAGYQCLARQPRHDFVDVLDDPDGNRTAAGWP